ncbi:MAG: sulfatase-like hydrolase/transferase [Fuerstiella sp.]
MNNTHFKTVAALARVRTIIEEIRVLANAATSKLLISTGVMAALSVLCSATTHGATAAKPQSDGTSRSPNILWISLEDITPMMGCYGDSYARTPVFDKLATEGIRYTSAHSIGPVCSVSRSSIITGMYPSSLGTHHHRSNVGQPPAFVKMLPNLVSEAGYYTSNNAKKDYNIRGDQWHESSKKAHWRKRPNKEQPFFAVFNLGACHSSITKISEDVIVRQRLSLLQPEDFHDPADAPIPPYHPDVPEFRKAWSRYYDAVTQVDYQAGEFIEQLKEDGLWEDTIVFVWADHGVGMPRGKHNAWEQGTHVPLIVRFPKKYQHRAPAQPGSVIDGLVTLMDLGPSTLAMVGLETPDWMHGRPLFCRTGTPARPTDEIQYRDYVIGMRDRLDSRYEMVRSVRDQRFRYQRNFYPHLPFKPHEDFEFNAPVLKKWVELARAGKLTGPQAQLNLRFKPIEELYDSKNDPHMINNVIDEPPYADVVKGLRKQLRDWMLETRDLGILDETETLQRAKAHASHWELGQSLNNYKRILETADLPVQGKAAVAELLARVNDPDSAVRFWAVLGLVALQSDDAKVVDAFKEATKDESISVAITAADGLFNLGHYEDGLPAIIAALKHPIPAARVRASCILDTQPPIANPKLQPALAALRDAASTLNVKKMRGIPYGLNEPFKRAIKAITGEETYYRW